MYGISKTVLLRLSLRDPKTLIVIMPTTLLTSSKVRTTIFVARIL